ncbi:MAG TPA: hypothetical protein DGG94_19090, partial [Micromonosporaceae bacterium]|nr:hypothetical protein [Micromonosporaceae bacterium]
MTATILGWLDGQPLARTELDRRLAALRNGPRSSALPSPGSAEGRQLTRWVAQVLLTEALCTAEATSRGLNQANFPVVRLDQRAAVELGSITAAAFEGCPAVRAVFHAVTESVPPDSPSHATQSTEPHWHLSTSDGDFHAALSSLPVGLARAVETAQVGETVTADGYSVTVLGIRHGSSQAPVQGESGRRLAFVRWLDQAVDGRLEQPM